MYSHKSSPCHLGKVCNYPESSPYLRNGTQDPMWVQLFSLELGSPSPSLLCPGLMQTNALILSSWGWQFASCRDISSSLAPRHLPTDPHSTQNKNKVAWPIWSFGHCQKECQCVGFLMVLWVRSKRGIHILLSFKRLVGILVRLFNHVRHRGTLFINSDSNTDLLFPKQLEIVCSFSSRILSLMMMMMIFILIR